MIDDRKMIDRDHTLDLLRIGKRENPRKSTLDEGKT